MASGFTLIELLVVVVIIGITVTLAVLSFGDFGEKRRIFLAAETLTQSMKLAQQYAILEHHEMRIRINSSGYQMFRFYPPKTYTPMSASPLSRRTLFPKSLWVNQSKTSSETTIAIDAAGEFAAFELILGTSKAPRLLSIIGQHQAVFIQPSPT